MFVARDEKDNRIYASVDTKRESKYYCPVCGGEVRIRAGSINAPHFAHINKCTDDFTPDMSEWHKAWQDLFPERNREVVISCNGESHRADVLCYGTVIEFQHSPISEHEFWRRNDFYVNAGYKVVWIFDLIDIVEKGRIIDTWKDWQFKDDYGCEYRWNYPYRFLNFFLPQEEENIDIFLQMEYFDDFPKSEYANGYMERVSWVNKYYENPWSKFRTSLNSPCCYAELLKWLKDRKMFGHKVNGCDKLDTNKNKHQYSYYLDGRVIQKESFENFLKGFFPYIFLVSGVKRVKYDPKEHFCPEMGLGVNVERCAECDKCIAIDELSAKKHYVYCKFPHKVKSRLESKIFRRFYDKK